MSHGLRIKIIGVSAVLVLLVLAAIAHSHISVLRLRNDLDILQRLHLPLDELFDQAQQNQRDIESHVERLIDLARDASPRSDAVAAERGALLAKGDRLGQALEAAAALTAEAMITEGGSRGAQLVARLAESLRAAVQRTRDHRRAVDEMADQFRPLPADPAGLPIANFRKSNDALVLALDACAEDLGEFARTVFRQGSGPQFASLVITGALGAVALLIGWWFARSFGTSMARTLRGVSAALGEVGRGRVDVYLKPDSRDEIGQLMRAFNAMVDGLRQKNRIKDRFGKYIDPAIVDDLTRDETTLKRVSRRDMTLASVRIDGLRAMSTDLDPDWLVAALNACLTAIAEPVGSHRGVIDKVLGDGVIAYYGPPFSGVGDHGERAALAALEQIVRFEQIAAELGWRQAGAAGEAIRLSVGIASGPVVAGDIGSELDRSYTVFGEPVDRAQMIERANGVYGTRLLIGEATRAMVGHGVELREVDQVEWENGFRSRLYEVIGRQGLIDARRLELRDAYARALVHYRDCEWAAARAGFELAAQLDPTDGPSRTMLGRLDLFMLDPPAKPWSGVWTLSEL